MLKLQRIYIKDSEWRNEKQSIVARKTDKMMDYRYIPWLSLPLKSPDGAGSGREKSTSQSRKDRKGHAKENKKSFAVPLRSLRRGETNNELHPPTCRGNLYGRPQSSDKRHRAVATTENYPLRSFLAKKGCSISPSSHKKISI